jgi:hypothetical protein
MEEKDHFLNQMGIPEAIKKGCMKNILEQEKCTNKIKQQTINQEINFQYIIDKWLVFFKPVMEYLYIKCVA